MGHHQCRFPRENEGNDQLTGKMSARKIKEETIDGWIPGAFPVVRTTLSFNSAPKIMVELGLSLNVLIIFNQKCVPTRKNLENKIEINVSQNNY